NQWADTATTPVGLFSARSRPSAAQARECRLSSMAFIGEPWPRNSAGWRTGDELVVMSPILGRGLQAIQGLRQILQQIVDVLDAHGNADHVGRNLQLRALRRLVGHARLQLDQRLHAPER